MKNLLKIRFFLKSYKILANFCKIYQDYKQTTKYGNWFMEAALPNN